MQRGSRPKRVQFSSKKGGSPGRGKGFPASFGTEGVRGLRGAVRGARGWGARASRLAHGGGGGGPSLGGLPGGGVCGGGSGSVIHRGFYSQPLFWGCRGVGSLGSQFSTGPAGRASGARAGGPGVSSAGETEKREKHRGGPGGGRRGKSSAHSKLPPKPLSLLGNPSPGVAGWGGVGGAGGVDGSVSPSGGPWTLSSLVGVSYVLDLGCRRPSAGRRTTCPYGLPNP